MNITSLYKNGHYQIILKLNLNFHTISNKVRDRSKRRTITVDTVLESWNFILWNQKILGTIGVPFGTQSMPINAEILKKINFYDMRNRHNGTQNGTPMVPKMSNGTQMVPKMVPKWYPNSLTHFIEWSIFIIFEVKKWPQGYFDHHFGYHTWFLGTIDYFFGTHTISATSEKQRGH